MSSSSKQKNFDNAVAVQTKHRMLSIAQRTLFDSKSRCSSRASGAHGARGFGRVRRSRFVSSRSGRSVGSRLGDPVRPGGRIGADSIVSQWQSVATSGQSQTPGYDYEKVWYPAMPVRSMRLSPGTPDICKARISLIYSCLLDTCYQLTLLDKSKPHPLTILNKKLVLYYDAPAGSWRYVQNTEYLAYNRPLAYNLLKYFASRPGVSRMLVLIVERHSRKGSRFPMVACSAHTTGTSIVAQNSWIKGI